MHLLSHGCRSTFGGRILEKRARHESGRDMSVLREQEEWHQFFVQVFSVILEEESGLKGGDNWRIARIAKLSQWTLKQGGISIRDRK